MSPLVGLGLAIVPAMHAFALLVMDVLLELMPVTNVLQVNTVNTIVLLLYQIIFA